MADIVSIIVGSASAIAILIAAYRTMRMVDKIGWNHSNNYDERQILSRGKAFRAGFLVTFCSCIIFAILTNSIDDLRVYAPNFLFIIGFAGFTVFSVIAIWTDSFVSSKFQPGSFFALYFIIGVVNLVVCIMNKDWKTAGEFLVSDNLVGFLIGISFITIAVVIAVKTVSEQREENR